MKVIDVSFLKMYRETIIVITIPIKFKGSILSWEIGALNRALKMVKKHRKEKKLN